MVLRELHGCSHPGVDMGLAKRSPQHPTRPLAGACALWAAPQSRGLFFQNCPGSPPKNMKLFKFAKKRPTRSDSTSLTRHWTPQTYDIWGVVEPCETGRWPLMWLTASFKTSICPSWSSHTRKRRRGMPGNRYFDVFWVTFTTKNWRNHWCMWMYRYMYIYICIFYISNSIWQWTYYWKNAWVHVCFQPWECHDDHRWPVWSWQHCTWPCSLDF